MQFPKKAKEAIIAPISDDLIKSRAGAKGSSLSYLSGSTVIDMLNNAFGYMWSWKAEQEWIQPSQPKFNPKYDKEPVEQPPVAHVKGTLTIHLFDENEASYSIVKTGYGSKAVLGSQMDQESIFKAAGTDALKKAASLLGIGLQLYRDEDEQFYFDSVNYEDPWTDELLAQFSDERTIVSNFIESNDLSDEEMATYYEHFSEGEFASVEGLSPDNIVAFASYLKQLVEDQAE